MKRIPILLIGIILMLMPISGMLVDKKPYPIFVNPYDPARGGINCDSDCSVLATGYRWSSEDYGNLAACAPHMIGCTISFENDFGNAGPFLCMDTGGALLVPEEKDRFGGLRVQHIDILWDLGDDPKKPIDWSSLPWWNHGLFYNWTLSCH